MRTKKPKPIHTEPARASDHTTVDAAGDMSQPEAASAAEPANEAPQIEEAAPVVALEEIVERLPQSPGVYLMKDKKGRIVYVGKAANLRQRVRSYFNESGDTRAFVRLLHRLLGDIETVVTQNEKEALLLENNLIKQHKPKFNVKLVDDKNYLVLRLDPKARYPRLEVTRRLRDDGARYFGPYHSAGACRQTLKVVNRHFKLRTCTDQVLNSRQRPCLQFQIKRCDAPCVYPIPGDKYGEQVRDVMLFLDGKSVELTERLRERMMSASEEMEYETAAALRDQLHALEQTLEEQRVVSAKFLDQDVFGYFRQGDVLEIAVLCVRQGKLLGRRSFRFPDQEFPDQESISSFVGLFYDAGNVVPDEVLLPLTIEDHDAKREWLRERSAEQSPRGKRTEVITPQRGARAKLVELANKNAEVSYTTRRNKSADTEDALTKLQRRLGLKRTPHRIECFDISHLQGTDTVASRVVFIDGEPARGEYRTFKVRSVTNNDFAAMYEVLSRRFRRAKQLLDAKKEAGAAGSSGPAAPAATDAYSPATTAARRAAALLSARDGGPGSYGGKVAEPAADSVEVTEATPEGLAEAESAWALPDLLVIDGGKGQLATALAALKDVGINWSAELDVIGLAKERTHAEADEEGDMDQPDRVFLPRTKDPIKLRQNTAELFVLSRIRDEAHRVAVGFHKKLRSKRTIRSQLADIRGVGPKRQTALLRALGSVRRIRECSIDELAAVPGMSRRAAEAVAAFFGHTAVPDHDEDTAAPADTPANTPVNAKDATPATPATKGAAPTTTIVEESNNAAENFAEDAASAELAEIGEADPEAALFAEVAALSREVSRRADESPETPAPSPER
jgi:excinuclease ABC subunit C